MHRPVCMSVVGVLGVIGACLGILGATQMMLLPKIAEVQKGLLSRFQKMAEDQLAGAVNRNYHDPHPDAPAHSVPINPLPFSEMNQLMAKFWTFPPWYYTWSLIGGGIGLLLCGFYLYAAIALLSMKRHGVVYFYWATSLAIVWSITKALVAVHIGSFMGYSIVAGCAFGFIFNLVLLLVVATSDQSFFNSSSPAASSGTSL